MLKVVENEAAIRRCHRKFVRGLKQLTDRMIPVEVGHPGASIHTKIAWLDHAGIWFVSRKIAGRRYWNAFGIGCPEDGGHVSIVCEINFPLCGIDRRTGGAFAEDGTGRIFVIHRGKLGGGKKGVGKGLFENSYRGAWAIMDDGGEKTPVAIIGVLQSPRFVRQIAQFVRKIARIKEAAADRSEQAAFRFEELSVREELIGDLYHDPEPENDTVCDHGLIVRDLSEALKKMGFRTQNDRGVDLMTVDRAGPVRAIFRIHTRIPPAGIRTAAMQLLLDGLSLPGNPMLLLVLPRIPEDNLREKLKRLNVNVLEYAWENDRAVFPNLAARLSGIVS